MRTLSPNFALTPKLQHYPRKRDEFADLAAESWFAFRRQLEKRTLILPFDGELLKQLSSRRLQYDSKARIQLEPKDKMRARGLSSPDRVTL